MTGMILTGKTRAGLCAACSQTLRLAACSWLLTTIQQYDIWHVPLATASNIIGATRLWTNFSYLKYRGKGLGGKMLAHAEKAAKRLRVRAIHLEVTRHNELVLHFYRREGFKDHDRHLVTKCV